MLNLDNRIYTYKKLPRENEVTAVLVKRFIQLNIDVFMCLLSRGPFNARALKERDTLWQPEPACTAC